ncbi:MAG: hypothetical protein CL678_05310 [Bdellovibrionaceae bacterium]|nr:hypothetical protein [Pseudobdellovibrionaceae bacterium]
MIIGIIGIRIILDGPLWKSLVESDFESKTAGTVTLMRGWGRIRSQGSSIWHDMSNGTKEVGIGDTIFTGQNSQIKLAIRGGNDITLLPNSVVVVKLPEQTQKSEFDLTQMFNQIVRRNVPAPSIDIRKGKVEVVLQSKKQVPLQVNGKKYQIKAKNQQTRVEIKVSPQTKNVVIDSPQGVPFELKESKKQVITTTRQVEALVTNSIKIPQFAIPSLNKENEKPSEFIPAPEESIGREQILLKIKKIEDPEIFKEEVTDFDEELDEKNVEPVIKKEPKKEVKETKPKERTIKKEIPKKVLKKRIIKPAGPTLVKPLDQQQVTQNSQLIFSWLQTSDQEEFDFVIARDPKFQKRVKSFHLKINAYVWNVKQRPGTYYWTVRSRNEQKKSYFSQPRRIIVKPDSKNKRTKTTK